MEYPRISGLYAITPDQADTDILIDMTHQALAGGARLIQYRNKSADSTLHREQAFSLVRLCRKYKVPFIINDHLDLAIEVDADGLHVGQGDIPTTEARFRLGQKKIVGASCYNRLELAIQAEKQGVDYVAFGAFFTSTTKLNTVIASVNLLCHAKQKLLIPVVAIGGVNLANAAVLVKYGSDAVAVSSALFRARNIQFTAEQFSQVFFQIKPSVF